MTRRWMSTIVAVAAIAAMTCKAYRCEGQEAIEAEAETVNLVYNGSFEEHRWCPRKIDATGVLSVVDCWYQPTKGSADYYNTCGGRECGVPANKLGKQEALDGEGYCGIYCSRNDYREYLQTRLRRRLHKGDSIRLTFGVSLSENSRGAVATIGGLFTKEWVEDTVKGILLDKESRDLGGGVTQTIARPYEPQVVNRVDKPLTTSDGWQEVSGIYVASGGEQYITIGNFYTLEQSGYVEIDSLTRLLPGAYYYVDNVKVECLNCEPPVTDDLNADSVYLTAEQPAFEVGEAFRLREVYFEVNKSTLLQQSSFELIRLAGLLEKHRTMKIEIGGHTDATGADSYNQRLSEARAKAVMDYLVSRGVDERRLKYKGYGKSQPIDTNATEEGRANNRRVEFKITGM